MDRGNLKTNQKNYTNINTGMLVLYIQPNIYLITQVENCWNSPGDVEGSQLLLSNFLVLG